MKTTLLCAFIGLVIVYIKTCEARFCTESYSCRSTCYRQKKYKTNCGWFRRCTKYKREAYSCYKTCYRQVCCKGYTLSGKICIPSCFGKTTCPNGGRCVRPDYCDNCARGYARPNCSVCQSTRLPRVSYGVYKQNNALPSVASLSCNYGYEVKGDGNVVCQVTGYWSSARATCQPKACGPFPIVANGQFKANTNSVSLNAVATLKCSAGYTQFPTTTSPYTVRCGANGKWTPASPTVTCALADCGLPVQVPDGQYDPVNGTLFGNQAILSCSDRHVPLGEPDFIQCLASGKWSISPAMCEPACPDGWIEYGTSCYFFSKVESQYTTARQFCLQNNSTLVQVDTVDENDFLKMTMEQLAANDTAMRPKNGYWNDLYEATVNGEEVWRETNTTLDPNVADWNKDQPNDHGGQQSCTMFWRQFKYMWADIECDAIGKPDKVSNRLGRALCEWNKNVQA